ncbi:MAG: DNA polymerase III subunit delta' [Lachnospiraceae bacterium]
MGGFESIVGHGEIISYLQNSIANRKVSHSYLFTGETGAGKKLLANMFAMTLQCKEQGIEPCLKCSSCKKAMSKNHPDIINVFSQQPGSMKVDEVREQVVSDVGVKPYESPYKIYIINDAEKMTVQAQNAVLKTIEEPPAYVVILLLANNEEGLLPTILSRCVKLHLKALQDSLVKNYLIERLKIPDYKAQQDALFARGNIGRAQQIAKSEDYMELTNSTLRIVKQSSNMQTPELIEAVKWISQEKTNIYDFLTILTMWFRDILMFKATREVDTLVFKEEINEIKEQARQRSYEGLENILQAIEKAETRLRSNVNFDLTMELLFLTIREK